MEDLLLFGLAVVPLVVSVVEGLKSLGLQNDAAKQWVTLGLAVSFGGLAKAISMDLVPVEALPWIEVGITGLVTWLSALGLYSGAKRVLTGFGARL